MANFENKHKVSKTINIKVNKIISHLPAKNSRKDNFIYIHRNVVIQSVSLEYRRATKTSKKQKLS